MPKGLRVKAFIQFSDNCATSGLPATFALSSLPSVSRVSFVMPQYRDTRSPESNFKNKVVGEGPKICSAIVAVNKMKLLWVTLNLLYHALSLNVKPISKALPSFHVVIIENLAKISLHQWCVMIIQTY